MFFQKITFPRFFAKSQSAYQVVEAQTAPIKGIRRVGNELRLTGSINCKNYLQLIDEGRQAYKQGAKQLVVDLEDVDETSTSGLFALYSLLLIFDGEEPPVHLGGHAALAQMSHDLKTRNRRSALRFKNAAPKLKSILTEVGL